MPEPHDAKVEQQNLLEQFGRMDEFLAPDLVRTDDLATDADLRIVYELDPEEDLGDGPIEVCAGEWRRDEPGKWRFWSDPAFDD